MCPLPDCAITLCLCDVGAAADALESFCCDNNHNPKTFSRLFWEWESVRAADEQDTAGSQVSSSKCRGHTAIVSLLSGAGLLPLKARTSQGRTGDYSGALWRRLQVEDLQPRMANNWRSFLSLTCVDLNLRELP